MLNIFSATDQSSVAEIRTDQNPQLANNGQGQPKSLFAFNLLSICTREKVKARIYQANEGSAAGLFTSTLLAHSLKLGRCWNNVCKVQRTSSTSHVHTRTHTHAYAHAHTIAQ